MPETEQHLGTMCYIQDNSCAHHRPQQIMMEYCVGGSVQDVINKLQDHDDGTLCEGDVAFIIHNVVSGLQYLHSHRIIHRYIVMLL